MASMAKAPDECLSEMTEPEQPELIRYVEALRPVHAAVDTFPRRPQRYRRIARRHVSVAHHACEHLPHRKRSGKYTRECKTRISRPVVEGPRPREPPIPVRTENLSSGVLVVKSAKDGL
jgi:hypothetical protein